MSGPHHVLSWISAARKSGFGVYVGVCSSHCVILFLFLWGEILMK
jgi:hypothetical protein